MTRGFDPDHPANQETWELAHRAGEAAGRAAERADVVRVLKVSAMANIDEPLVCAALKHAAGIIERGEHEGAAERGKARGE